MHLYYTNTTHSACRKDKTLHLNSKNVSTQCNAEGKAFHNAITCGKNENMYEGDLQYGWQRSCGWKFLSWESRFLGIIGASEKVTSPCIR